MGYRFLLLERRKKEDPRYKGILDVYVFCRGEETAVSSIEDCFEGWHGQGSMACT